MIPDAQLAEWARLCGEATALDAEHAAMFNEWAGTPREWELRERRDNARLAMAEQFPALLDEVRRLRELHAKIEYGLRIGNEDDPDPDFDALPLDTKAWRLKQQTCRVLAREMARAAGVADECEMSTSSRPVWLRVEERIEAKVSSARAVVAELVGALGEAQSCVQPKYRNPTWDTALTHAHAWLGGDGTEGRG